MKLLLRLPVPKGAAVKRNVLASEGEGAKTPEKGHYIIYYKHP